MKQTSYAFLNSPNVVKRDSLGAVSSLFFSQEGRLLHWTNYKSTDSLESKAIYTYTKKGKRSEQKWIDAEGGVTTRWIWKWDRNGNETKEFGYGNDGELWGKTVDAYNRRQLLVKSKTYTFGSKRAIAYFEYYPSDRIKKMRWLSFRSPCDSYSTTFSYDSDDRLKELGLSSSGYSARKTVEYDSKERIISEKIYVPAEEAEPETYISYEYDEESNVIESKKYVKIESAKESEFVLAEWTRWKYEYDLKGNWILRTQFEGEMPIEVIEREIDYYD